MFDALSPARRRFVLGLCALATLAVIAAVAAALISREPAPKPVSQDALGPVLLVPGYGGATAALDVLADALRQSGRDATVVALAGDGTGDLRKQAEVVDEAVQRALERTGAASVDLVGYSAGGVTARLWARDFGSGLARRIVTLGSPHHGTDLAGLAADVTPDKCPTACHQLATDSDLLRALNATDETPDGPLWVSIWTTDDQTVVPPDSASLEGALAFSVQSVCPGEVIAHADIPRTPSVLKIVLVELGRADPAPPTSEVCAANG